eukprot:3539388-Prymnesium_polylepis.2
MRRSQRRWRQGQAWFGLATGQIDLGPIAGREMAYDIRIQPGRRSISHSVTSLAFISRRRGPSYVCIAASPAEDGFKKFEISKTCEKSPP